MIVSRDYINTSELVDFGSEAFLKIPIQNYVDLLDDIALIPAQIALINAINDPRHRFITGCLSRRTGKTFIANVIAQLVLLVPGSAVLIIAPNYALSSISWDLQRNLLNKFGVEITKNNAKDRILTLANTSSIRMGSVSTVDSTVGRSYDLILFDEAALNDKGGDAFNIALRPTLDKPNSKAIFISTPRKNNFFKEYYERGFNPAEFPDWASVHSTYLDNPRSNDADVDAARRSMSDAEFKQEYMADFSALQGAIFPTFTSKHIIDYSSIAAMVEVEDVIAGLDVGFRDATAFCVFIIGRDGRVFLVEEYQVGGKNTDYHAKQIRKLLDKWDIDFVYIDSAAAQTKYDLASMYDISCVNAKKALLPGISYMSSLVEHDRLYVDASCKRSIYAFENYAWDMRPGLLKETPIHDGHEGASHMADAIRYALYSHSMNIIEE